jgi:hypothetical protein
MPASFEANAPFDEMCQRAAHDIQAYLKLLQGDKKPLWDTWAGARLPEMMNSKDGTLHYLKVTNASLRLAAASLVADYWHPDESFAAPCLTLAFSDPEPLIRGAALSALVYKLHSYVEDKSGMFRKLLTFLRSLDPSFSDPSIHEVQKHAAEVAQWAGERALLERQQLAGKHLDEMMRSVSGATAYLDDPVANIRAAAILLLYEHWKIKPFDLRSICMRMVMNDRDMEARIHAQGILSCVCFKTDDREVGRLLARIVRDNSEPIKLRKAAYVSLFSVRGLPAARILQAAETDFQDPSNVDWGFVETFL